MPKTLHHTKLLNLLLSQEGAMDRLYRITSVQLAAALKRYKLKRVSGMWAGNKSIEKEVDRIIALHGQRLKKQIVDNIENSWNLANNANDEVVNGYLKGTGVPSTGLLLQNTAALAAFTRRKTNDFNLSDRVWRLNGQTKEQLESLIGSGILEGRSAVKMAGDLKQYLKEPNRRYRRLRDKETGKLILSNPAKNYHPGQGVYRSSYKNALRLSRNETNIAYRTADHLRIQQMPFVVGYKVHLSNAHPEYDICDELVGKYPKDFKFTGWHVNCLCFTTTIQLPKDKFIEYMNTGKLDSSYNVKTLPTNATKFIGANIDKIKKSKPYFYSDNPKYLGGKLPKAKPVVQPKTIKQIITVEDLSDSVKVFELSNPSYFVRGFKKVFVTERRGVNGFTDMNGNIALKQSVMDDVIDGFNNINNGFATTYNHEKAISTLHHEIIHNANVPGYVNMTPLKTRYMEQANEFVSRKTLPDFMEKIGGKLNNRSLINNRDNTGYNTMVNNYDYLIEATGSNPLKVLEEVKYHLINGQYTEQFNGLKKAIINNSKAGFNNAKITKLLRLSVKYRTDDFKRIVDDYERLLKFKMI